MMEKVFKIKFVAGYVMDAGILNECLQDGINKGGWESDWYPEKVTDLTNQMKEFEEWLEDWGKHSSSVREILSRFRTAIGKGEKE